ncbi:integrin alpha-9-like [Haemaphysalis longicornis]
MSSPPCSAFSRTPLMEQTASRPAAVMIFPSFSATRFLTLFWALLVSGMGVPWATAYNLDTQFPVLLRGPNGSHFGFSVALHRSAKHGVQALVGAIRANSTHPRWQGIYEPGVLYRCALLEAVQTCTEVIVDATGNEKHDDSDVRMRYEDLKDNMTLGMSLDVSPDRSVVVCAPLWKNQLPLPGPHHRANGACYVLDQNLMKPKKLVPLVDLELQTVRSELYYYAAEMGLSAAFTEDGRLVLGAPGFYLWEGSVTRYDENQNLISPHMLLGRKEKQAYKGYSVTTGRFFRRRELTVAVGSPRGNDYKGQVFLFGIDGPGNSRSVDINSHLLGSQMCEYFGASLLAIDLDKDGVDDLLVGAPSYTINRGRDEGRVYVFRSNGVVIYASGHMDGHRATAARFGTAMANVGDLNMDGIQDVAVGAPYENDVGAVYIYHGSPTLGERAAYAQRIDSSALSSRIGSPLEGFGISISKGLDIDSNRYNDIMVGSYMTDSAVLLRSRPIAQLKGFIRPEIDMITADISKCPVSGKGTFSCFNLTTCVQYSGEFVNDTADLETELKLDVKRVEENHPARGFMLDGPARVDKYSALVLAKNGRSTCEKRLIYLDENFVDPLIPFAVRLEYRLRDTGHQHWCPTCPVPDRKLPLSNVSAIPYQHGCGSDDICQADMKLAVNISNYDGLPLVVGERRDLSLLVFVENGRTADPAYQARVWITLPERVQVVNKDQCSVKQDSDQQRTLIVCEAGNPLRPSTTASFRLKLDASKVQHTFVVTAEAETRSKEVSPSDNKVVLTLPVIHQADISMLGKARPEVVTFNGTTKSIELEHGFLLSKKYPSPIQQVQLSIRVPHAFSKSEPPITYVKDIKILQGDLFVPGTCLNVEGFVMSNGDQAAQSSDDDSDSGIFSTSKDSLSGRVQRSVPEADSPHSERLTKLSDQNVPPLNCKTSLCDEVKCIFGPFLDRQKIVQVVVSVVVDMEEFRRQAGTWHAFSVGSEGYLEILDNTTFTTDAQSRKEIRVATVFQKEGPPPAEEVPDWIIAASAFAGLLLFSLIVAGLVHVGFFRRQQKEALEKFLSEEDGNEWDEFAVRKTDGDEEREPFRKSMMADSVKFSDVQEETNTTAEDKTPS